MPDKTGDSALPTVCSLCDGERYEIAAAMLEDFDALDVLTGWSRPVMASLLGCKHPEPDAWLDVEVGELEHSRTVVRFIREVATGAGAASPDIRAASLLALTPDISEAAARLIASREACRSAIRLSKDLLRRARGSTYAVERALADGEILRLVVDDSPGDALFLGYELLAPRSRVLQQIEAALGSMSLVAIDEDDDL